MSINSNNIDRWLFDYYEGNLSPDDIRKLEQFLKKNPEYYEDADAWKESFVEEAVPAFSPAFLLKEPQADGKRKKLAYAALLLLLLVGGSATVYYLLPDSGPSNTAQLFHTTFKPTTSEKNLYTQHSAGKNNIAVNHTSQNSKTAEGNTHTSLSFTPDISRLQQLSNHVNTYTASIHNNIVVMPRDYVTNSSQQENNTHTTVDQNNVVRNSSVHAGNIHSTSIAVNHTLNNNNTALTSNNVAALTANTINNNVSDEYNAAGTDVNDVVLSNIDAAANGNNNVADVMAHDMASKNSPNNTVSSESIFAEDINLTVESTTEKTVVAEVTNPVENTVGENNNTGLENTADANAKNGNTTKALAPDTKITENGNKSGTGVVDIPSELNPDVLLAKKDDLQKKLAEAEKDKTKIPTSEKGIGFTNRRQVTLLQGINSEFESNASFISQHYATEAYAGVHFTNASPIEKGSGALIGASQYFRKAKTTLNAFGSYDRSGYIQQAGLTLQLATQFKLDRYQILIPSISMNATQYQFQQLNNITSEIPSYSAGLLTGNSVYNNYQNATKFNLSAGMLYHHKKFYTGLSFNGLLQPKFKYETYDRLNSATNYTTVNMVVGTDFVSKKYSELSLSPQISITVRDLEAQFSTGAVLRYKAWGLGAGISSAGVVSTYAGYTHRMFSVQYRYVYDKLDAPFRGLSGHFLTTHFNLKSFVKKQKPILDSEK